MSFGGIILGVFAWFIVRYAVFGFFKIDPNQRAVVTSFGRAERLAGQSSELPDAQYLSEEQRLRYRYPQVRVTGPGLHWKWPWQSVHKVSIATETISMAMDPDDPRANQNGAMLKAVARDQLDITLLGQIRYRISEANLYAYLFGVKRPLTHVMGYFVSVLRQRIAAFEAPTTSVSEDGLSAVSGVSVNDIRKNLRDLNEHMDRECKGSVARYGIALDASLITEIDSPDEVDSALAAINTAHNQISSEISLAQAAADQKIVQSRRAVEIETLRAQAEAEPLAALAEQLTLIRASGGEGVLRAYLRNTRLGLWARAKNLFVEVK